MRCRSRTVAAMGYALSLCMAARFPAEALTFELALTQLFTCSVKLPSRDAAKDYRFTVGRAICCLHC